MRLACRGRVFVQAIRETARSAWPRMPAFGLAFLLAMASSFAAARVAYADDNDASLVMDAETGEVLYSSNGNESRIPASLTKMMTLYLVFERLEAGEIQLRTRFRASAHAVAQDPTKLGLEVGNTIDVENAIRALIIRSANDVAVVIAEGLGGTEERFARLMTQRARKLGMTHTTFYNASGLPHPRQRTSARDMAILARALMKDFPQYFHYFSEESFTYGGVIFDTHNKLVTDFQGTNGIKTGYTRASGFNLTTSVERDGRRLIGVVLGGATAKERDADMRGMLDSMFRRADAEPELIALYDAVPSPRDAIPVPVAKPEDAPVAIAAAEPAPTEEVLADMAESAPEAINETVETVETEVAAILPVRKPDMGGEVVVASAPEAIADDEGAAEGDGGPVTNVSAVSSPVVGTAVLRTGDWGIQVGAFSTREQAQAVLTDARDRSGGLLSDRQEVIAAVTNREGQTLYRARYRSFDLGGARKVCAALTEAGLSCLPFSDGGE